MRTRFAPSTTGPAHPGTLLSALLVWLEARAVGGHVQLRLEDLDPYRCKPEFTAAMPAALAWLGLDWDEVVVQSQFAARHAQALDRLADGGYLYPCNCTRARLRDLGRRSPDGGWAYDNHCRGRALPAGGWRASCEPLRVALPDRSVMLVDAGGLDLSQTPAVDLGDPIVRRRDGAVAYHLASVVDDSASGITHVIRGRDLAASAATQVLLYELLGEAPPTYRHHFLLLEARGGKLSKLHGAVDAYTLSRRYTAPELCGMLAYWAGLRPQPIPCRPAELLADFAWERVRVDDLVLHWDGRELTV